ncbi:glycosyl hydrolase family 18 protein [Vibrio sp. Isolate24]|uniref:glycosyl hydrolase family 18 protein n=1 Tax=Vibrio sp. Isolate24 TaxID=2908534 RepID=UPI001EFCE578|nr:glycosyl hydrolase family 18 protein [Vibrio sp. Isolate24]MCG9677340.1 glycosyl hydrolase family 18 protein [Vibrio sp. Isolate24]
MSIKYNCQLSKKGILKPLSAVIALSLGTVSMDVYAAPSAATLDWNMTSVKSQSFVEINGEAGQQSYKKTVVRNDQVTFPVEWDVWYNSGTPATEWQVRINDEVIFSEAINGPTGSAFSGETQVQIDKAGQYDMTVNICDANGECSTSPVHAVSVTDTDGKGMAPLEMNVDGNNQSFPPQPDGTVVGTYFVEWSQYDRKFTVDNIPADNLTHIIYGFVPICGPNDSLTDPNSQRALQLACGDSQDYEVVVHDQWGAFGSNLPGTADSSIKGTYGQMMALKQRYPDLKILPSIGGWTLSDPFFGFTDKKNRDTFVASVKEFLLTWKFYDGVDIDWEYPGGTGANPDLGDPEKDGPAYVALMRELRQMLDELSAETGRTYELTSAIGAGWDKIEDVDYPDATQYMDYLFVMTYDFYGAWDNNLGHQAALYCGSHVSSAQCEGTLTPDDGPEYTTDNAAKELLKQGVSPSKLVLGAAMYGRGWKGVTRDSMSDPANPITGVGNGPIAGSWEPGVIDYKDLASNYFGQPGVEEFYDEPAKAPYLYKEATGEVITYDDERSVKAKAAYVRSQGFAGLFSWEIDADNGDILNAMQQGLLDGGEPGNQPPVADAGNDIVIDTAQGVQLDGSGSRDNDGSITSYQWEQVSGPNLSITDPNKAIATVTVPDTGTNETYSFKLTVMDDENATSYDTMSIKAEFGSEPENTPPVADISGPEQAEAGNNVVLDASGSNDADGDNLTYQWSSSDVTLTENGDNASFIAPEFTQDTHVTVSVTVSDGKASDTASLSILVKASDDGNPGEYPQYVEGTPYEAGDRVTNVGENYECKPYPYSGWCSGAAWAYAPGTGSAWSDAWIKL